MRDLSVRLAQVIPTIPQGEQKKKKTICMFFFGHLEAPYNTGSIHTHDNNNLWRHVYWENSKPGRSSIQCESVHRTTSHYQSRHSLRVHSDEHTGRVGKIGWHIETAAVTPEQKGKQGVQTVVRACRNYTYHHCYVYWLRGCFSLWGGMEETCKRPRINDISFPVTRYSHSHTARCIISGSRYTPGR